MTERRYSMLVLWSDDDEAFLAHVIELQGCVAHGETREEAVRNGAIEKQTALQAQRFQKAVQEATQVYQEQRDLVSSLGGGNRIRELLPKAAPRNA
jgi:predicted RNase H-like HicB family nuclease